MHVLIKLKNGDTVMGKYLPQYQDKPNFLLLQDALYVYHGIDENDVASVFFEKFCCFNKGFDINLRKDNIMQMFNDPLPYIVDYYNEYVNVLKSKYVLRSKLRGPTDTHEIEEESNDLFKIEKGSIH